MDDEIQHTAVEDTGILIANHPVLFKLVSEAREQNQKPLLRIMRELLSTEEKEFKEIMKRGQSATTREAYEAMEESVEQLEKQKTHSDNTVRQGSDAFKAMLAKADKVAINNGRIEGPRTCHSTIFLPPESVAPKLISTHITYVICVATARKDHNFVHVQSIYSITL